MDYRKVIDLFNADGKPKLIKRNGNRNLMVLDSGKQDSDKAQKIRIVVPAEAATMRAESQLEEDIKTDGNRRKLQSGKNRRRDNKRRIEEEVKAVIKDTLGVKRSRK